MSEAEMIGGIAATMRRGEQKPLSPTHDYRKVVRSNPDDTTGAKAANARAEAFGAPVREPKNL